MKKSIVVAILAGLLLVPMLAMAKAKSPFTQQETWQVKKAIATSLNQQFNLTGKSAYGSQKVKLVGVQNTTPAGLLGVSSYSGSFTAVPKLGLGGCYGTCKMGRVVYPGAPVGVSDVSVQGQLR